MLYQNNQTLRDPADIAECFSENFYDIPRSLHEHIQPVNDSLFQYVNRIENSLVHFPITESDVVREFSRMKPKKSDIGEVPFIHLKYIPMSFHQS